ncbi:MULTISPECIES: amidase [Marinobacter]|uniref:amidase n=1 Tax=Marinobacter TaxID=2742 RepID=UPI0009EED6F5|nr:MULTISPECIES: amidase [unclassified Marinobacter]PHS47513.1 MAG: amidase [Marinobacter sp.]
MNLTDLSAADLAGRVQRGAVTVRSVADAFLQNLELRNPDINALIYWSRDDIHRQSQAIQKRINQGEALPLAGVPIAIKDNLWVKGWPITQGSRLFEGFIAPEDSAAVARLRTAGAIILGMANSPEFACRGVTTNELYGPTRNPWDLERTPGGSSGGSASAVAARLCPLSLGTDAGGSIRRPASHTGILGFMPSCGTVPEGPGFEGPDFGNSTIGVFARTVGDIDLVMGIIGEGGRMDPGSAGSVNSGSSRPLRLGFSPDLGLAALIEPDVARSVSAAVDRLRDDGLSVLTMTPRWPKSTSESRIGALEKSALAAMYGAQYQQNKAQFDPDVADQIREGLELTGVDVANALRFRKELHVHFIACFESIDVLLCPTAPVTAWPLSEAWPSIIDGKKANARDHAAFSWMINQVFAPACSVPCGTDNKGLPVGLQIIAPRFADQRVLTIAKHLERLNDYTFLPLPG